MMKIVTALLILCLFSPVCQSRAQENSSAASAGIANLLESISVDSLKKHIDSLCWAGGHYSRVSYTPGNHAAADYITRYLESLPGLTSVVRDTFYLAGNPSPYNKYPLINIIAYKEGSAADAEIVLVGGHYDASCSRQNGWQSNWKEIKAQGADDNASGVSAMLEIARVLCDPVLNYKNQESIKFIAFAAEEYNPLNSSVHHAGSIWDAGRMSKNKEPLKGALILDMIAYNTVTDYIEVIANPFSFWLADVLFDCAVDYTPQLKINDMPVDVSYSDHQSYQDNGFSAILLMENDNPWNDHLPYYRKNPHYHTAGDTIGSLNFSQLTRVTQLALSGLYSLARSDSTTDIAAKPSAPLTATDHLLVNAYPNPFNAAVTLHLDLKQSGAISARIFNAAGQLTYVIINNEYFNAGQHRIKWDATSRSSGIYFCAVSMKNGGQKIVKLILMK